MLQSGWRTEKYFLPATSFAEFPHTRAIGEPAHWNNQSNSCLPLGARRRCSARSSILARRVTSHPCHADYVLSPGIVRIIEGLAEDWHRLDERIDHLSDEIAALAPQDAGCERLVSVPGRPIISSAMVATMRSRKAATSPAGQTTASKIRIRADRSKMLRS